MRWKVDGCETGYLCGARQSPHITQCLSASSKWINTLVHPHSGILLSNKKEWADKHNNLDGSQMHYAKRKNHINVCQLWLKHN